MRKNEVAEVKHTISRKILRFKHFFIVDASNLFLSRLEGVMDPEVKRRIIASTFFEVFEEKTEELEDAIWENKIFRARNDSSSRLDRKWRNQQHLCENQESSQCYTPRKSKLAVLEPLALL